MTKIYFKDEHGQKVSVEVTEEVAAVNTETRRGIWRNEAKERYYRGRALDTLTDDAIEMRQENIERNLATASPEDGYIEREEAEERQAKIAAALKTLTPEQIKLIQMLRKGMTVGEIAKVEGVDHSAIAHRRRRIQKKFQEFLK
jgi:DNA-binding NarL/FixJ family response regulator